jgi:hypothetical protein
MLSFLCTLLGYPTHLLDALGMLVFEGSSSLEEVGKVLSIAESLSVTVIPSGEGRGANDELRYLC